MLNNLHEHMDAMLRFCAWNVAALKLITKAETLSLKKNKPGKLAMMGVLYLPNHIPIITYTTQDFRIKNSILLLNI